MQPAQTPRLAAVMLLLTVGFPQLSTPVLLPAAAQTVSDSPTERLRQRKAQGVGEGLNRLLATAKQHYRRAEFKSAIALYQQALTQAQQTGDVSTQIEALLQLGDMNFWIDDVPQAEAKFQQALKLARAEKDRTRAGAVLAWLSAVYWNRQDYAKAIALLKESSAIAQQTKNQKLEARSRFFTGIVLHSQQQYPQALKTFQQALKLAQVENNQDEIAHIYNWIALTFIQLKDFKQAETTIQQQQKLSRDTGYRLAEYGGLKTIATLKQEQKQTDAVLKAWQHVLAIAQSADNPWFQRMALVNLGFIYVDQNQVPKGLEFYQKALAVARTSDDNSVGWVQRGIGVAYHKAKQYPQALESYQQAIATYQKTGNQFELARVWRNVGQTYLSESRAVKDQNNYAQAFKLAEQGLAAFQQSLEVARRIPDQPLEAAAINAISQAYDRQGDVADAGGDDTKAVTLYVQALKIAEQALAMYKQLQNQEGITLLRSQIGYTYTGLIRKYDSTKQFDLALESVRKAEKLEGLTDEARNLIRRAESLVYYSLARAYNDPRQYVQQLEILQKNLELAKQLDDRQTEGRHLVSIGQIYYFWGRYAQALDVYRQALSRSREVKDYDYEVSALLGTGSIYGAQANYPEALKNYQQALQLSRANNVSFSAEQISLNNIANIYKIQGQYAQAMSTHQQILATHQQRYAAYSKGVTPDNIRAVCLAGGNFTETGGTGSKVGTYAEICDNPTQLLTGSRLNSFKGMIHSLMKVAQVGIAASFSSIGGLHADQGDYPKALEFNQKALGMFREQSNRTREAYSLNTISTVYANQGDYAKAIEAVQQALNTAVEQNDPTSETIYQRNLGSIYASWGKYPEALVAYQRSLALAEQLGRPSSKALALSSTAEVFRNQGKFAPALTNLQSAKDLWQKVGEPANESRAIRGIGDVYSRLGQYPQAIAAYQQALAITRRINARPLELATLAGLATVYREQGQAELALKTFQQTLSLAQTLGDRTYESLALAGIGKIYLKQAQPVKALASLQPALTIQQQIGTRPDAADTFSAIGQAQVQLGTFSEAQGTLQQAIALARETGDAPIEAQALNNLGQLFTQQKQPELAIAFYKQSVGLQEEIKGGLKSLARSQQESYAQSVSGTYRALADLLLAQGRVLEAQQVLELLKIQEIREFTREVKTAQPNGIATTASEAKILKEHGTLIAFGQKVTACKQSRCTQLSQFNDQQQALTQQYNQTVDSFEKEIRQRKSVDDAVRDPRNLSSKAKELVESQPGTVLIYPFVLEDKIWLLWAAKNGIVKSVAVPVSRKQLGETVVQFRTAVQSQNPGDRTTIVTAGKQLYDWLIKPLESELKANKIQNLVFSLDRVTRYIPMSALFDGEKFLIETYAVSTVLSAELTDLSDRLPASNQTSILAMGASKFKDYSPLQNVPRELNAIVQQKSQSSSKLNGVFSGSTFLNQAFTFRALRDNLLGRKILHIATHGKFVSGRPEDSFLVLGSGEKLTIPEIKTLQDLSGIHLVVLSACETALGGPDQDGVEISGLSSYFLSNGAKAVMASLWSVDDASTSELMAEFYRTLAASTAQKPMTKAEALRQAQLSLIREGGNFARPYFWAPFILIGNGL